MVVKHGIRQEKGGCALCDVAIRALLQKQLTGVIARKKGNLS
jgi:hypothetical protein